MTPSQCAKSRKLPSSALKRSWRVDLAEVVRSLKGSAPPIELDAMHKLVGIWRLVSWRVVTDGQEHDLFGERPRGYLILTQEGRSMALTTAQHRVPGDSDVVCAALHRSMLAYSGRYRIEGNEFVTTVDVSWNESWNGTEQRRHFEVDGNVLRIESAPGPSITNPGRTDFRRIEWEREG